MLARDYNHLLDLANVLAANPELALVRDSLQVAFYDSGVGTQIDDSTVWWWHRYAITRLDAAIGTIRAVLDPGENE